MWEDKQRSDDEELEGGFGGEEGGVGGDGTECVDGRKRNKEK